jgi:hypothetical protein
MARIPVEVALALLTGRGHIHSSTARIARGLEIYDQMQARIRASMALIERAGSKWPTNGPTSFKPIDTSIRPGPSFESRKSESRG